MRMPELVGPMAVAAALLMAACGGKVTNESTVEVAAGGAGGHAGAGGSHTGGSAGSMPTACAIEVASGYNHACAVRSDHTLWCWGASSNAEIGVQGTSNDVRQIAQLGDQVAHVSPGREHTCAVKLDGSIWCWGSNAARALGFDQESLYNTVYADPIQVSGIGAAARVVSGSDRTCAILQDGTIWCWGSPLQGCALPGDGKPKSVTGLYGQVADAAVSLGACARRVDGTLWCWSWVYSPGAPCETNMPKQVMLMDGAVVEVSRGEMHTCATKLDHTLWCWGTALYGGLADGSPGPYVEPVQVTELGTQVRSVEAGPFSTCAIKLDGSLWCWGHNDHGQIGDGTQGVNAFHAAQVAALGNDVEQVAPGRHHTCARKKDGSLWCWGLNDQGQLGDGTKTNRPTPGPVNLPCPW